MGWKPKTPLERLMQGKAAKKGENPFVKKRAKKEAKDITTYAYEPGGVYKIEPGGYFPTPEPPLTWGRRGAWDLKTIQQLYQQEYEVGIDVAKEPKEDKVTDWADAWMEKNL